MKHKSSEQNAKEQVLNGWTKFQELILAESIKIIMPLVNEHKDEIGKNLWDHLFDTGDLTPITRNISRDERYFNKFFFGVFRDKRIHAYFRRYRSIYK
jgi:hypothetical protein